LPGRSPRDCRHLPVCQRDANPRNLPRIRAASAVRERRILPNPQRLYPVPGTYELLVFSGVPFAWYRVASAAHLIRFSVGILQRACVPWLDLGSTSGRAAHPNVLLVPERCGTRWRNRFPPAGAQRQAPERKGSAVAVGAGLASQPLGRPERPPSAPPAGPRSEVWRQHLGTLQQRM
jgi:hypothetical protein